MCIAVYNMGVWCMYVCACVCITSNLLQNLRRNAAHVSGPPPLAHDAGLAGHSRGPAASDGLVQPDSQPHIQLLILPLATEVTLSLYIHTHIQYTHVHTVHI